MANDSIHEEEGKFVKELVASREYLFKQLVDMCIEVDNKHREIAWRWIMENRKWPSKYKVYCKPSYRNKWQNRETRFGWYMVDKDNNQTMEQVADKGSSTIPYELNNWCWITPSDLKVWYTEEEAIIWLVRQLCRMMEKKKAQEERKKLIEASAGNQIS
jgi:hypothetical protein